MVLALICVELVLCCAAFQEGSPRTHVCTQPVAPPTSVPRPAPSGSPRHSSSARIQHALPISPTADGDDSSLHRSDGRRAVSTEHSPALNKASKLYGQPDWWGQDVVGGDDAEARNKEFEFAKPGSQILRQFEPEQPRLSLKADELRMQAISNSRLDPTSLWVIDFGNGSTTGTLPKVRRPRERGSRPRSADPSPNRLSVRRDPSPLPKRAVTPTQYKRHSSVSTPSTHITVTPITRKQRATTPPVSRPKGPSKKPPYSSPKRKPLATPPQSATPRSKTPQSTTSHSTVPQTKSEIVSTEPTNCEPAQSIPAQTSIPVPIDDARIDLKSLNEGPLSQLVKSEEDTYTAGMASSEESNSVSSLSDQFSPSEQCPVVVTSAGPVDGAGGSENGKAGAEGEGSSANRKQWTEGEVQVSEGGEAIEWLNIIQTCQEQIGRYQANSRFISPRVHNSSKRVQSDMLK